MRPHPPVILLLLLTVLAPGRAGDFGASTRVLNPPEMGAVTNWVLHTPKTTYAFMPPIGWTIEPRPGESRLVWVSTNAARIHLSLAPKEVTPAIAADVGRLTQIITNRYPEATLRQTLPCYTEAERGAAFDLAWIDPQGAPALSRVAVVCVARNTYEFTLTAPAATFASALPSFQGFMTSFQELPRTKR